MATVAPPAPGSLDLFATDAAPGIRRIDLHVPAIHCAGCIRTIEGAVLILPGVTRARVNFTTRRLTAEWESAAASPADILAAVEEAGFDARPFAPADA
ncbi:MAG: cation transporter, partial [Sandaracinobacteroides sp.]